jgi:hypothetical protein
MLADLFVVRSQRRVGTLAIGLYRIVDALKTTRAFELG